MSKWGMGGWTAGALASWAALAGPGRNSLKKSLSKLSFHTSRNLPIAHFICLIVFLYRTYRSLQELILSIPIYKFLSHFISSYPMVYELMHAPLSELMQKLMPALM